MTEDRFDIVNAIIDYEQGDMEENEVIEFFQKLIDNGLVDKLQGHYGRTAKYLVDQGLCHW